MLEREREREREYMKDKKLVQTKREKITMTTFLIKC